LKSAKRHAEKLGAKDKEISEKEARLASAKKLSAQQRRQLQTSELKLLATELDTVESRMRKNQEHWMSELERWYKRGELQKLAKKHNESHPEAKPVQISGKGVTTGSFLNDLVSTGFLNDEILELENKDPELKVNNTLS
jgi:hypothetical protein